MASCKSKGSLVKQTNALINETKIPRDDLLDVFSQALIVLAQAKNMTYENLCDFIGDRWY